MIRAALALHEATGERDYLDRALAWQAALDRHYANRADRRLFPHRRRRRRPGGAPELHQRRRHAQSQCGRRAEPGAARRLSPASMPGATRSTACSTACCRWRRTTCSCMSRCSTRSTCGCAAPRSWSPAPATAPPALVEAALKLPFLDRIVVRAPSKDALPPSHPAAAKLAAVTEPAAFICAGETCSLPVTAPEQIAATMMSMRACRS